MSTITELRSSNVKCLTAVSITPPATGAVVIGGKNEQGKSSCLDSILYALAGKGSLPEQPVRRGEKSAEITVTISTDPPLLVTRKIRPDGKTTLEIKQKSANGIESKVSSPQKVLDSLVGTIAFDPLEFTRQNPQEQVEILQALVGVDTSEVDRQIADAMDFRKEKKAELATYEAVTKQMPVHADVPPDANPIELEDVQNELTEANLHNQRIFNLTEDIAEKKASLSRARQAVAEARKALDEALEKERRAVSHVTECETDLGVSVRAHADMNPVDTAPLLEKSANIGTHNQRIKENAAYRARGEAAMRMSKEIDQITFDIEDLRSKRIKLMDSAKWPVKGLGFDSKGVTFDGLPFTQCSSAKQLRISTAIGLAQNPTLKLMLIREGSNLWEDNLQMVHEIAVEHDAQVWIERVSKGPECFVIIEDGAVLAQKQDTEELEAARA